MARKPSPMPKRKSRQRYNFSNTRLPVRGGCTPDCKRSPYLYEEVVPPIASAAHTLYEGVVPPDCKRSSYLVRGGCTPDCKRSPYLVRGGCTPDCKRSLLSISSSGYRRIAGATRSYKCPSEIFAIPMGIVSHMTDYPSSFRVSNNISCNINQLLFSTQTPIIIPSIPSDVWFCIFHNMAFY